MLFSEPRACARRFDYKKASKFSTAINNIRASFHSQMSYERFTGEESQSSSSYEISSAQTPFPLEEMANRNSQRPAHATSRSGKAMQVVLFRFFTPSFQRKSAISFLQYMYGQKLTTGLWYGYGMYIKTRITWSFVYSVQINCSWFVKLSSEYTFESIQEIKRKTTLT